MSHQFTTSKRGRRLIKAFEGFRPADRTLLTGQRIVGYGHKVRGDKAMLVTRSEANALLKSDLAPYEDMINSDVHAPLNQNQFDALVSLAFSIGPKAFLSSPTLHLMNNGRPLDAARSFDIWRKSRVDGRAYIVDALVRRRAVEKALFLRPVAGIVAASRVQLPPVEDSEMSARLWNDDLPYFEDREEGYVSQLPYEARDFEGEPGSPERSEDPNNVLSLSRNYSRRREDGPAGILTLSEIIEDDDLIIDDLSVDEDEAPLTIDDVEADETGDAITPSPIAIAAAEVVDRLDALIDNNEAEDAGLPDSSWPESLITTDSGTDVADDVVEDGVGDVTALAESQPTEVTVLHDTHSDIIETPAVTLSEPREADTLIIDNVPEDTHSEPAFEPEFAKEPRGLGPYLILIVTGLTLMGASLGAILKAGVLQNGDAMPFWPSVGGIIGAAILLFALYYVLKSILRRA